MLNKGLCDKVYLKLNNQATQWQTVCVCNIESRVLNMSWVDICQIFCALSGWVAGGGLGSQPPTPKAQPRVA